MLITFVANLVFIWLLNRYRNPDWEKIPTNDQYLYIGSILFGLGWGLAGYSLGPVFVLSGALIT